MVIIAPRAPALVVACMRVGRSGNLRTPMAASTMKAAPTRSSTDTSTSIILNASTLHESGKANGSKKGCQGDNDGNIQETCHAGINRVHTHVANHDGCDQLQRDHPVRQRWTTGEPDEGKE